MTTKLTTGTYQKASNCDSECIFTFEIVKRTAKTVTIVDPHDKTQTKRCKIHEHNGDEYIFPLGQYSMAPIIKFRDRVDVPPAPDKVEEVIAKVQDDLDAQEAEGGFTIGQLRAAFSKVENKDDWRAPINVVVPLSELEITVRAIRWFTATEPKVILSGDRVHVNSDGYRMGPAGDH